MSYNPKKKSLELSIRHHSTKCFRIVLDGDVFWADSYQHAVLKAIHIIMRDEINKGRLA